MGTPTSVKIIPIVEKAKIPLVGLFTGAEALRTPVKRPYFPKIKALNIMRKQAGIIPKILGKNWALKKKYPVFYQGMTAFLAQGPALFKGVKNSFGKKI